jgi:hypothetical protein
MWRSLYLARVSMGCTAGGGERWGTGVLNTKIDLKEKPKVSLSSQKYKKCQMFPKSESLRLLCGLRHYRCLILYKFSLSVARYTSRSPAGKWLSSLTVESVFLLTDGTFYLLFIFSFVLIIGGALWHLQKFLQYIIVEFTPSIILLYLSSPNPGIVSASLIFPFSYMST